ncbi:MAG: hypothetical protein AAGI91_14490 [Bacteroidota bacterium]
MSDTPGRSSVRLIAITVGFIFLAVIGILVFRGCHESGMGEDQVRPTTPLPGTQETGMHFIPDAPLLPQAKGLV